MKILYIIFFVIIITKNLFGNNIFEPIEYEINFSSSNINIIKEKKINEIKLKSFQSLFKQILTKKNIKKINFNDIDFVNLFILNYQINNEKIINNNYFANIKINFNQSLIIKYLIDKKIDFVRKTPNKFLLVILETNNLNTQLFSYENKYYQYLNNSTNELFKKFFELPNLDFNDRYIFNEYHFNRNLFEQNNKLNKKYGTEYQILINSINKDNIIIYDVNIFYNNQKYFVAKIPINNLNYEKIFNTILVKSIDRWKEINQINTSLINTLECRININNINELSYVRGILKSNILIKELNLKLIELNSNTYSILFVGSVENFKNSLHMNRLSLFYNNNLCNIELA